CLTNQKYCDIISCSSQSGLRRSGHERGERMGTDFAANPLHMQQKSSRKPKGLPRGRPFPKGLSGNPMGKRPGTRNRATIIAEEMLDSAARPLLRGAID